MLFGFESFRLTLWGADIMTTLGLKWLPTLRTTNVFAYGEELDVLEQEAGIILLHSTDISEKTKVMEDLIQMYANNLLNAVQVARRVDGQVCLW